MNHFRWTPGRRGFGYWFPRFTTLGLVLAAVAWSTILPSGDGRIVEDFGLPGGWFVASLALIGISTGLTVGLLNQWIATRLAACLVAWLAMLPPALLIQYAKLSKSGSVTLLALVGVALITSGVTGTLYGLVYYRATTDESRDQPGPSTQR